MNKKRVIKDIHGHDTWCVPSAFSILTGLSTDTIRCLSVGLEGETKAHWSGVLSEVSIRMLKTLGIDYKQRRWSRWGIEDEDGNYTRTTKPQLTRTGRWTDYRPTLNQWASKAGKGLYLIAAGGHMMLYHDGRIYDNGSWASRTGVHWFNARKLRAKMHYAWRIDESSVTGETIEAPEWAKVASSHLAATREKARSPYAKISERLILGLKARDEAGKLKPAPKVVPTPKPVKKVARKASPKPTPKPATKTCARCPKTVKARGLCGGCYRKAQRAGEFGGKQCKTDGCTKIAECKGLCHNCYHVQVINPIRRRKGESCDAPQVSVEFRRWNGLGTNGAEIILGGERVGTISTGHSGTVADACETGYRIAWDDPEWALCEERYESYERAAEVAALLARAEVAWPV